MFVAPWVYENIFMHDKDLVLQDGIYQDFDLAGFFSDAEVDRGISLDSTFLNNDYVFSKIKIDEADLKGAIVSTDIIVKGQFIRDDRDRVIGFSGKLFSRDVILNQKSFMPLRMSFSIENDELKIESLRIDKSYELKGRLSLVSPFKTDLRLDIVRADIRGLTKLMKTVKPGVAMGIINGVFYIKGNLANLFSDGFLESRNGKVGPIEYDSASIRLEGFGPTLNIVDSNISYGNSIITVDGYLDLRNFAKGGLFGSLRIKSDMKRLAWDGWDITKRGADELSMEKDISDKIRIGFKTMSRDPLTGYNNRENPEEMSLEYKIGMENLKMKLKENEEFFGIEHSIEF